MCSGSMADIENGKMSYSPMVPLMEDEGIKQEIPRRLSSIKEETRATKQNEM